VFRRIPGGSTKVAPSGIEGQEPIQRATTLSRQWSTHHICPRPSCPLPSPVLFPRLSALAPKPCPPWPSALAPLPHLSLALNHQLADLTAPARCARAQPTTTSSAPSSAPSTQAPRRGGGGELPPSPSPSPLLPSLPCMCTKLRARGPESGLGSGMGFGIY
jgi:hypothetical protein